MSEPVPVLNSPHSTCGLLFCPSTAHSGCCIYVWVHEGRCERLDCVSWIWGFDTREKPRTSFMARWGPLRGNESRYVSCCSDVTVGHLNSSWMEKFNSVWWYWSSSVSRALKYSLIHHFLWTNCPHHVFFCDVEGYTHTHVQYNLQQMFRLWTVENCDFWSSLLRISLHFLLYRRPRVQKNKNFVDPCRTNGLAGVTGGCRLIHKQSLALYLKQRTLAGLLYNLHVHSISRLLCCQLSCRLYLHALCTWEIWDVAQLSICAPVVVATGCLVYLPWFACQHVNKNHQIMSHQFCSFWPQKLFNWNELFSSTHFDFLTCN